MPNINFPEYQLSLYEPEQEVAKLEASEKTEVQLNNLDVDNDSCIGSSVMSSIDTPALLTDNNQYSQDSDELKNNGQQTLNNYKRGMGDALKGIEN